MRCEAAICRIPLGARLVAGRRSLKEPQYAWDYASVRLADKALAYAEFNTHPREGIIGVDDLGRGPYPAAEPGQYLRRWKYTAEGANGEILTAGWEGSTLPNPRWSALSGWPSALCSVAV